MSYNKTRMTILSLKYMIKCLLFMGRHKLFMSTEVSVKPILCKIICFIKGIRGTEGSAAGFVCIVEYRVILFSYFANL